MKKSKKTLAIVFALALVVLMLAGCTSDAGNSDASAPAPAAASSGDSGGAASGDMKFALAVPTLDNPYFIQVQQGFEQRCKELGVETVINAADYDSAVQYSQFENYVQMGVAGVACCPVDQTSLADIILEGQAKGMKFVGEAQAIDAADGNIVVDDYGYGVNNGEQAAKWINEVLGGKAKVVLITLDHQEQVKLRGDGMEDTIKKLCPDSEIVFRQKSESIEEAMNVAETALQAHPDVKVIACVNDQMAIGANEAVQNMGLAADDFYIGGGDWTDEVQSKMKEPGSCIRQSTDIGPVQAGIDCAQMLWDMLVEGLPGATTFFTFTPHWQADLL